MKSSRSTVARLALVSLLVATSLLVFAPSASANVRVPDGSVPFYARLQRGEIFHTDDWAAIAFYRPPSCIPEDFDLLGFFDIPGAFACNPATTQGFGIWVNGPATDMAPKFSWLEGLGAVPVWFVSWPALQPLLADGDLTIVELSGLQPLVGSASFYHEVLRPIESVKLSTIELNAMGTLEDGRRFRLHIEAAAHIMVQITFK